MLLYFYLKCFYSQYFVMYFKRFNQVFTRQWLYLFIVFDCRVGWAREDERCWANLQPLRVRCSK